MILTLIEMWFLLKSLSWSKQLLECLKEKFHVMLPYDRHDLRIVCGLQRQHFKASPITLKHWAFVGMPGQPRYVGQETVQRQSNNSPESVQRQSRNSPSTVQRQSRDSQETVQRQSRDSPETALNCSETVQRQSGVNPETALRHKSPIISQHIRIPEYHKNCCQRDNKRPNKQTTNQPSNYRVYPDFNLTSWRREIWGYAFI